MMTTNSGRRLIGPPAEQERMDRKESQIGRCSTMPPAEEYVELHSRIDHLRSQGYIEGSTSLIMSLAGRDEVDYSL
jgi:hypothetical protein